MVVNYHQQASISYSCGCNPHGASVPLHPQRRDVRTIARHTIYKHLIEKSNATSLQKERKDVTKTYKEICWSSRKFGIAMQDRIAH